MDAFPQRKSKLVVHGFLLCVVSCPPRYTYIYLVLECLSYYISSIEQELVFSSKLLIWFVFTKLPNCQQCWKIKKITEDTQVATPTTRIHLAYWRQYISQFDWYKITKKKQNSRRNNVAQRNVHPFFISKIPLWQKVQEINADSISYTHIRSLPFRKHFILVVWNMTRGGVMHHRLLLLLLLSLKYIVVLSFLLKSQPEDRQQQRLFKMSRQQKAKPLPDIFDVRGAKTLDPYEIVYKPGTAFVKLHLF